MTTRKLRTRYEATAQIAQDVHALEEIMKRWSHSTLPQDMWAAMVAEGVSGRDAHDVTMNMNTDVRQSVKALAEAADTLNALEESMRRGKKLTDQVREARAMTGAFKL